MVKKMKENGKKKKIQDDLKKIFLKNKNEKEERILKMMKENVKKKKIQDDLKKKMSEEEQVRRKRTR